MAKSCFTVFEVFIQEKMFNVLVGYKLLRGGKQHLKDEKHRKVIGGRSGFKRKMLLLEIPKPQVREKFMAEVWE